MTTTTRLPFEPLWRVSGAERHADLAHATGYHERTIGVWARLGIPLRDSDRAACKGAGVHPSILWPDWFDLMAAADRCLNGHEYTVDNTWVGGDDRRHCRTCHRDRQRRRWQRLNKSTSAAGPPASVATLSRPESTAPPTLHWTPGDTIEAGVP
jgi:hypothetical protein